MSVSRARGGVGWGQNLDVVSIYIQALKNLRSSVEHGEVGPMDGLREAFEVYYMAGRVKRKHLEGLRRVKREDPSKSLPLPIR